MQEARSGVQVLHDSPGRLRLAVPTMTGSRERAHACTEAVRAVTGVQHVQANPLTGNLLILYPPSVHTTAIIEEIAAIPHLRWFPDLPSPAPQPASAHPTHRRWGHAGALALTAELLPHLLPLLFGACPICRR